ncbi:MAG: rod shape-determining protein MreD [Sedimentisphaerales bacterium]|nr:rod shape-determining protein MreD [Sedimentisphaerales bacterium]
MPWPRFAVVVLTAALVQLNWVDVVAVTRFNVTPDLLLILMVFFAINCALREAIICSFIIGLAADIVATGFPMGPRIISFGLFGTALAYLHRVIAIRKIHYQALTIFLINFCGSALSRFLTFAANRSGAAMSVGAILGTSVYSAVTGPFLFMLLDWSMRIKSPRRRRR